MSATYTDEVVGNVDWLVAMWEGIMFLASFVCQWLRGGDGNTAILG